MTTWHTTSIARGALLLCLLLAGCTGPLRSQPPLPDPPPSSRPLPPPPAGTPIVLGTGERIDIPAVREREAAFTRALATPPFIVTRPLSGTEAAVQMAAIHDPRVHAATRTETGEPLRSEVFSVARARPGDLPPDLSGACGGRCFRTLIYNFATNTTIIVVSLDDARVLDVQVQPNTQPEIPAHLATLARDLAVASPEAAQALGLPPNPDDSIYEATKTSLRSSACERRNHLCVAPIFLWPGSEQALWVIVDLTDHTVIGAAWSVTGAGGRRSLTEATLANAVIAQICDAETVVERGPWRFAYLLTSSDGLEVRDLRYRGQPLIESIKIVDWHVGYTLPPGSGFADAIGCPVFSQAAIVPFAPPELLDGADGAVTLHIRYQSRAWPQACNYVYVTDITFSPAGSIDIDAQNLGRGCNTTGFYHPVIRIAWAEPAASTRVWDGQGWQSWTHEQWTTFHPEEPERPEPARIAYDPGTGPSWYGTPAWGHGDRAYLYISRYAAAEGAGNLETIGTVGRDDERQGPEQFLDPPEPLGFSRVVWWYVPRIKNVERRQCWADVRVQDGRLVPEVWPCRSGLRLAPAP